MYLGTRWSGSHRMMAAFDRCIASICVGHLGHDALFSPLQYAHLTGTSRPCLEGHCQVRCPSAQVPHTDRLGHWVWKCPDFWCLLQSLLRPSRHRIAVSWIWPSQIVRRWIASFASSGCLRSSNFRCVQSSAHGDSLPFKISRRCLCA
jgi:hypothetical protein